MSAGWAAGIRSLAAGCGLLLLTGAWQGAVAEGDPYLPAYNALVEQIVARCALVGISPGTIGVKTSGITFADLNALHNKTRELLSWFVVPPPYVGGPWTIDEAVELAAFPSLMVHRGAGFLVVPGAYTSDGLDLTTLTFAGNYNDVPLLWEQFEDLQEVLASMRFTLKRADWSPEGKLTLRKSEGWDYNMLAACNLADEKLPNAVLQVGSSVPELLTTVEREIQSLGHRYRARAQVRGAYAVVTGVPARTHRIDFYAYARQAYFSVGTAGKTYQWDPYGHPGVSENTWSPAGSVVADAAGRAVSPLLGPDAAEITKLEPWCDPPLDPATIGRTICRSVRGFELMAAVAIIEWPDLPTGLPEQPQVVDTAEDGLVHAGCACNGGCEPRADPAWRAMLGHPSCRFPLGVSSAMGGGGVQVQAYLSDYEDGGQRRQFFSLDTYARQLGGSASKWHFVLVKRPSGAEVLFSLKGNRAGQPVNGGGSYRATWVGGACELVFSGADTVIHRFNGQSSSGLIPAGSEVGQVMVERKSGTGTLTRVASIRSTGATLTWPGLVVYRQSVAMGRKLSAVNSADGTDARPVYGANGLVTAVTYGNGAGETQAELSVSTDDQTPASGAGAVTWRYQSRDGAGTLRDQVRVVFDGTEAAIHRHGALAEVAASETLRLEGLPGGGGRAGRRVSWLNPGAADASSNVLAFVTRKFAWGEETVREEAGPDGANPMVTTYAYHEDPGDPAQYGRLRLEESAGGGWTRYGYDPEGRVVTVTEPLGDAAPDAPASACRVTTTLYAGDARLGALGFPAADTGPAHDARPRVVIVTEEGHEVGRTYDAYLADHQVTRECRVPGAAYDDPSNRTRLHRRFTSGAYAGRLASVDHGDGTFSRYQYASLAGGARLVTTHEQGVGSETAITHGTRTVTEVDTAGRVRAVRVEDVASGLVLSDTAHDLDGFGRVTNAVERVTGRVTTRAYGCCGVEREVDADGIETLTDYTPLRQVNATTRGGVSHLQRYDAAGRRVHSWTVAGVLRGAEERLVYDEAGRLVAASDGAGVGVVYGETQTPEGGRQVTTLQSDGGVVIERFHRDGTPRDVRGSAATPVAYRYGASPGERWVVEYRGPDTNATEWVRTVSDMLGRQIRFEYPDGYQVRVTYDAADREVRREDGFTTQLSEVDPGGRYARGAVDMNGNGVIDLGGPDRVTESRSRMATVNGRAARVSESLLYADAGSTAAVVVAVGWSTLDGTESWQVQHGRTQHVRTVREPASRRRLETHTSPDGVRWVSVYTNGLLLRRERFAVGGGRVSGETRGYDALQRLVEVVSDAANGESHHTRQVYDEAGRVAAVVEEVGARRRETQYRFEAGGRLASTRLPDGGEVRYTYDARGALTRQEGARQYPLGWSYDEQGRLIAMATWRDAAGAPDVTRWEYDGARGWLSAKRYADGTAVSNRYDANGALSARVWARGVETRYAYDAAGGLTNILYSDDTPAVSYRFDRRGRRVETRDGVGVHVVGYGAEDQRVSESLPQWPYAGLVFAHDAWGRVTNRLLSVAGEPWLDQGWVYDDAGRVAGVQAGDVRATYDYGADGHTVTNLEVEGVQRVSRQFDGFGRLEALTSLAPDGTVRERSAYTYDAADQRVEQRLADGRVWVYGYDTFGQLIQGRQFFADGTPVGGRQFEYGYDAIGNRTRTRNGRGQRAQTAVYMANALNRYEQRQVPGEVFVTGEARPDATVLVKPDVETPPLLANRHADYFWAALAVSNQAGPVVLTNLSVIARWPEVREGVTTALVRVESREAQVVGTPERFVHDADGNLLEDGLWRYAWDAENRLTTIESRPAVPLAQQRRLTFTHDHAGRRVEKRVCTRDAADWVPHARHVFLWDGWTLLAEVVECGSTSVTNTYLWGLDLSDTPDGAGGIGGLLAATRHPTRDTSFFTYDGNGNVTTLTDPTGATLATYAYGPFGEPLRATGPAAADNPWRFSTRYTDTETGLVMYPKRPYSPILGRWLSRDKIGEHGGPNLHAFVGNQPVRLVDPLGTDAFIAYRKLGIRGLGWTHRVTGHVYLAFNNDNMEGSSAWQQVLQELGYARQPWHTFSFHPDSVRTKTSEGNNVLVLYTGTSWVDRDNLEADIEPVGRGDASLILVTKDPCEQVELFRAAHKSYLANQGGKHDRGYYSFAINNCGSWAKGIVEGAGLDWPTSASFLNGGTGLGGPMDYTLLPQATYVLAVAGYEGGQAVGVVTRGTVSGAQAVVEGAQAAVTWVLDNSEWATAPISEGRADEIVGVGVQFSF